MKLRRIMRGYYREQVDGVNVTGGIWKVKHINPRAESRMMNVAFHTVLLGLIVTAMLSGYYHPSRLEEQMGVIIERYNIEDRLMDSLDSLIIIIKNNRNTGGEL